MTSIYTCESAFGDLPARSFETTHWTQILTAADPQHPAHHQALANLCESYWHPLYAFVRRKGYAREEAEDLVQEFFTVLLAKNYVQQADRARGRFRTFLLSALSHFLTNDWHRRKTLKRSGGSPLVSWDALSAEERYAREPCRDLTPEQLYDRQWALGLLERVKTQLRREYVVAGKAELFEVLQPCLFGDTLLSSYAELGGRLKMSASAVKVAVHRMRRSFGERVRREIAETVATPQEVDEELQHLFEALRR